MLCRLKTPVFTLFNMQETIQQELLQAFTKHGIQTYEKDGVLFVPAGSLEIESRVTTIPSNSGKHVVRVDVATYSSRLGVKPIVESFAGIGDSPSEAVLSAFVKFLLGTFHVLIEALSDHSCNENQGEWFDWRFNEKSWRVCCGPVISQSELSGESITKECSDFFKALEPLYLRHVKSGTHWIRIFVCAFQGKLQKVEVLLDNEPWIEAEDLAWSWGWVTPDAYTTARHFSIALALNRFE
jgi:hypothetical protein